MRGVFAHSGFVRASVSRNTPAAAIVVNVAGLFLTGWPRWDSENVMATASAASFGVQLGDLAASRWVNRIAPKTAHRGAYVVVGIFTTVMFAWVNFSTIH